MNANVGDGSAATTFETFFRTPDQDRGAFLSRLFGIFNEKVVEHWCKCPQAPYGNLGRPTLKRPGERSTLDFALRKKYGEDAGTIFVAEMKCRLVWGDYRYIRLQSRQQLEEFRQPSKPRNPFKIWPPERSFEAFLTFAKEPSAFCVTVGGDAVGAKGSILIWSAVSEEGRQMAQKEYGLADVLSVENMLAELHEWNCVAWQEQVEKWRGWSASLFDFLVGKL